MITKRPHHSGYRAAFSLIELLVVIAVIGVLAALLLTVLSQAKARARQAQCAHNLRQLGLALEGFRTDHHAFPPYLDPSDWSETRFWMGSLNYQMGLPRGSRYIPQGIWKCPAVTRPTGPWWENHKDYGWEAYAYNAYGLGPYVQGNSLGLSEQFSPVKSEWTTPVRRVTEGEVVSPSEMLAIGDALFGAPGVVVDGQRFARASTATVSAYWGPQEFDHAESTRRAYARHQGRANAVFCDGHVESPTLKALFEDDSDAALSRWNRDHQPHRERLITTSPK